MTSRSRQAPLTVAAFTGMVRAAVMRGESAVSWQTAGADVTVTAPGQANLSAVAGPMTSVAMRCASSLVIISHDLPYDEPTRCRLPG